MNSDAPLLVPMVAQERVLGIQRKLHKWAQDDQDRRFSDLHNLVCDPATLVVAWQRVRTNRGSRSAGVDGQTAGYVEKVLGVEKFLGDLREELRSGGFRPDAVKQRAIPKLGGKLRHLGIARAGGLTRRPRLESWHSPPSTGRDRSQACCASRADHPSPDGTAIRRRLRETCVKTSNGRREWAQGPGGQHDPDRMGVPPHSPRLDRASPWR
ncbi:MAG: hypothetical protein WBP81_26990 [Solirubrobacteraceae bacterium]